MLSLIKFSLLICFLVLSITIKLSAEESHTAPKKISVKDIWNHYSLPQPKQTLEYINNRLQETEALSNEYFELHIAAAAVETKLDKSQIAKKRLDKVFTHLPSALNDLSLKHHIVQAGLSYHIREYEESKKWLNLAESYAIQQQHLIAIARIKFLQGRILYWQSKKKQFDESLDFIKQALKLYEKTQHWQGIAYSHNVMYGMLRIKKHNEEALFHRKQALMLGKKLDDKFLLGNLLLKDFNEALYIQNANKAEQLLKELQPFLNALSPNSLAIYHANLIDYYGDLGDIGKAKKSFDKAQEYFLKLKRYENLISIHIMLARIYSAQGNHNQALSVYFGALEEAEKHELTKKQGIILGNIGINYRQLKQYEKSEYFLLKKIAINEADNNFYSMANAYGNLGEVYSELGKKNQAIQHYYKSIELAKTSNNKQTFIFSCSNLAETLGELELIEEAIDVIKGCLPEALALKDFKRLFHIYMVKTSLLIQQDKFSEALKTTGKAKNYMSSIEKSEKEIYHDTLITIYKNQKNYQAALFHQEQKNQILVEHNQLNFDKAFSELAEKYETKQKENQIVLLNQEKQNQQLQLNQQNLELEKEIFYRKLILSVTTTFLLFVLFSIYFYISRRETEKVKSKVLQRTRELEIKSQEAKILFNKYIELYQNFSHEFRTPISIIAGNLERLKSDNIHSDNKKQSLVIAQRNTQLLAQLIERVIELSKPINMKGQFDHTTQPEKIIQEIIKHFESVNIHHQIHNHIVQKTYPPIQISQEAFEQIINNLISNAIKYTPQSGKINIKLFADTQWVTLKVEDNGIGIAESEQEKIFERFYRASNISQETIGTGLGLALVKEATELCGGRITLHSQLHHGTSFTLDFPIFKGTLTDISDSVKETYLKTDTATSYEVTNHFQSAKTSILIVEDNRDLCELLINHFQEQNYHTMYASNGQKALEHASNYVPDLIISDINMPNMDGFELLQQVKQNTATSHTPVILLTARASIDNRIKGWQMDADGYLSKPFDMQELTALSQSLLHNREIIKNAWNVTTKSIEQSSTNSKDTDKLSKEFVFQLNQFLQENLDNAEITVGEIAKQLALSTRSFQRKLKLVTGESPSAYLRAFRLENAKNLIHQGYQINDVTYLTGFKYPSNFTSAYKSYFGHLPSEEKDASSEQYQSQANYSLM